MSLPSSWADAFARFSRALASVDDAEEWLRQATGGRMETRQQRALAFQRLSGVVLALEDRAHDLAFDPNERDIVNALILRYFGVPVEGPPWRVQPHEERPAAFDLAADFGPAPDPAERLTALLEEIAQRPPKKKPLPPYGLGAEVAEHAGGV